MTYYFTVIDDGNILLMSDDMEPLLVKAESKKECLKEAREIKEEIIQSYKKSNPDFLIPDKWYEPLNEEVDYIYIGR